MSTEDSPRQQAVDATAVQAPDAQAEQALADQQVVRAVTGEDAGASAMSRRRALPWAELAVTAAAFVLAFLVGAILMVVSDPKITEKFGYFFARPGDALGASWTKVSSAYGALFEGSLGSWSAITHTTSAAAPLIVAGLGVGLAFRAGLFNIGAQGQAVVGSIMAAWVGFGLHLPAIIHLPLAVLAGLAAGALWGGIVGLLKARAGAHEVIVTIMMNYVATGLLSYLLTTKVFRDPGKTNPISPPIDNTAMFPRIDEYLHVGFLVALAAAAVVWWLMERTTLGFRIRAVGANPHAAATAGMSVPNTTTVTMALAGALAGLAGVMAALAPQGGTAGPTPLSGNLVGSVGFDAITVALLGRSRPFGTVLAGLLFGAMHAGGLRMQSIANTPLDLTNVLQALIVLFVAAPMLVRTVLPFLKERRRRPAAAAAATAEGGLS